MSDWHNELNRATEAYNMLLKHLAEERFACIAIEVESKQTAANGIQYNVLEWHCYAAPCGFREEDSIHGTPIKTGNWLRRLFCFRH